jgi:class 3 adenylate cyclase
LPAASGEAAPEIGASPAPPDPRSHVPEHLAERIRAGRGALEGERKQVTVLFADVMGSMELAEQSDPEEWRRIMERFFAILSEGVHRFEGTVDKFTGDGIMALFGAPIAHEDHARRACYAALYLQEELASYAAESGRCDAIIAAAPSLDTRAARVPELSLRWIVVHLIEETARHVGHIDLFRERADGMVGEDPWG